MKRVSRWAVGPLALFALTLMCDPSVRAQEDGDGGDTSHWEVFFECTGSRNGQTAPQKTFKGITPDYYSFGPAPNMDWGDGQPVEVQGSGSGLSAQIRFPGTRNSASITVTPILRWVSSTNVPVPSPVTIRFKGDVNAGATSNSSTNPLSSSLPSFALLGNYDSPYVDNGPGAPCNYSTAKNGFRAKTIKPQGVEVRLPSLSGTFAGSNHDGTILFAISEDDRIATLSRSGAHDERVDSSGVTHGDTTYSYLLAGTHGSPNRPNNQSFIANFSGGWTEYQVERKGTDHTWNPNPDIFSYDEVWRKAGYQMPYGNINKSVFTGWEGSATGQAEKSITYTVKDNRNNEGEISAEPKYVLHIHDPVEVLFATEERVTVNVILYGNNGLPITTPDEPGGVKAGSKTVEHSSSSSSGWSVGASFDVSEWIKILGLDFQYSFSNEETTTTTASVTQDIPEGEHSYAMVTHGYKRHHKYLLKYDAGGRNVRLGHGAMDGSEDPYITKEVPHEAFADEKADVSTPFWAPPIPNGSFPPATSTQPPPFQSTYTS